jgi:hypothetical protein
VWIGTPRTVDLMLAKRESVEIRLAATTLEGSIQCVEKVRQTMLYEKSYWSVGYWLTLTVLLDIWNKYTHEIAMLTRVNRQAKRSHFSIILLTKLEPPCP